MPIPLMAAGILAGGSLVGKGIEAYGNYKAGKASAEEIRKMAEANKKFANEQYEGQYGAGTMEEQFRNTGTTNLSQLQNLINSGELYKGYGDYTGELEFDPSSVDVTQDPGYAFRLSQGQQALDASAASQGGMFSGAQQKALMEYGQNLGSQEYQNAYQRQEGTFNNNSQRKYADYLTRLNQYNQNLRNQVGDLGNMVGIGERALGRQGAANSALTGQVMGINNTIGNANAIDAGAGWNAISGVGGGISNMAGDVGQLYAMGAFNSAPTPTPAAPGSLADGMDLTDFNNMNAGQQDTVLNMNGLNTNLFNQLNNPFATPSNSPWTRGV